MPFKRLPGGGFRSPSGKLYTAKQVGVYYATEGFKKSPSQLRKPVDKRPKG